MESKTEQSESWNAGVVIHPEYKSTLQANGLSSLPSFFEYSGGESLGKPGLASWRQRLRLDLRDANGTSHTLYLKRYGQPSLRQQLGRMLRGRWFESTAGLEWRILNQLSAAGIPAPEPVAFGQEMAGCLERRSFFVMGAVDGVSLEKWLPTNWRRDAVGAVRRRQQAVVSRLARQVAAFHAAGFVHRDLYASHIFLVTGSEATEPRFVFIDLARVFRPVWRKTRWVVKDLAALHYSVQKCVGWTDAMRFWRVYVEAIGRLQWRHTLPARILAKAERVRRHDKRKQKAGAVSS